MDVDGWTNCFFICLSRRVEPVAVHDNVSPHDEFQLEVDILTGGVVAVNTMVWYC